MRKKATDSNNRYWRRIKFKLSKESAGVSEAIGTIMMLAIAMVLVGVVAVWVQTLPELPDQKQTNFQIEYEQDQTEFTIDIEHQGGDNLKTGETTIHLTVTSPIFRKYIFNLVDSDNSSLVDGEWSISEHWNFTLYSLSTNAEINIKIIDKLSDHTMHDEDRSLGTLTERLPDLEILPENITFSYQGDLLRINRPVRITTVVYNQGLKNASAIVRFFDDNSLISSGGDEYQSVTVPYKYSGSANNSKSISITWTPTRWGKHNINIKIYSPEYETNYANNFATKSIEVEISFQPPTGPDLAVRKYDINPSTNYPLHGTDLNISIMLHNLGDMPVPSGDAFNVTVSLGNRTIQKMFSNGIRARDSLEFFVLFTEIGPGEPTQITVEVDPDDAITETNILNNIANKQIQIIPTILVVDDDHTDSGKENVADYVMRSFTGRGITYDYYTVKGKDDVDPRYDDGPKKLKNYDIIVWVTGYEQTYTLTTTNLQNLQIWLENSTTTNRLWLIGQDVLNATVATPGVVNSTDFAYKYLGVKSYTWDGTPDELIGTAGDVITDGMVLDTSGYLVGQDRGLNITARSTTPFGQIYPILSNETLMGPGSCAALRYYNLTSLYKVVFFSFEFTSIISPYDLSNVSYHVLKWFNYTLVEGYDFGIVDQSFSNPSPNFMDKITISATVVNNGPAAEWVDVEFFVTDPNNVETSVNKYPDNKENPKLYYISGNGGKIQVTKEWLANSVGGHNFRVMVDPYDHFVEVVEENNDFSYYGLDVTELDIQYTILVVDDDNSTNNNGSFPDAASAITNAFDELNYYYVDYVVQGGSSPSNGPSIDLLKYYNTVVWLTGDDADHTLTNIDQQNLIDYIDGNYVEAPYLQVKVNLLLIGQNILDDINGSGNNINPGSGFVKDYLKITEYSTDYSLSSSIEGIQYNPISHGSNYPLIKTFTDDSDIIQLSDTDDYLFYRNRLQKSYNSLYFEHEKNHSRIAFMAWELSFVDNDNISGIPGENYLNEFIYLAMNKFDYPSDSVELKITKIDVNISEDKPNIGDSYIIIAEIYNYGSVDCSSIIRFYDGETVIDTDTIYVPGQGKTTSEIIWTPRYAGNRTIIVEVDIDNDVVETFNVLNNNATLQDTWVYFFYDDLEDGSGNWNHESTILRINGMAELEYMDYPVYSDIISNWSETVGFSANNTTYHTANSSYHMTEPVATPSAPFRYEFFIPSDKEQGFYAIGVNASATYNVSKADSNGNWQSLYENQKISVGQINRYASLDPYYLYLVLSSGPLIIVKSSLEGSNVNIPNYDTGSEIGMNFCVLGKKAVVLVFEPFTSVTIKTYATIANYNTAVSGGADVWSNREIFTFDGSAVEGTYQVYSNGDDDTPIWIQANKTIMAFRCSKDNDELDTAISTRGTSTGEVLYYPYVGDGHPPRIMVYNTGPSACTINVTEITASHHNLPTDMAEMVIIDWEIQGYCMDTFGWDAKDTGVMVPPDNSVQGEVRIFKVEIVGGDTTGLRVVYGGVSGGGDDFDVSGKDGSSDDTYDLFGFWDGDGNWRISSPLLVGDNGYEDLRVRSQHFIVGGKSDINVDGDIPIAFLDNSLTSNIITYFSVMDTVIHYVTNGTVTNVQVSGVTGATVNMVAKTITLPKGKHDTVGNGLKVTGSGTGTWYLGIKKFAFQDQGSFAWQLKNVAKWNGTDYSLVRFLPGYPAAEPGAFKYCWNYTSEDAWIFIVDGKGNCWIHTILPFEGSISSVGHEAQVRSARSASRSYSNSKSRAEDTPSEVPIIEEEEQSEDEGSDQDTEPRAKKVKATQNYLISSIFSLENVTEANLLFYHKYNLLLGFNGALIQVGTDKNDDGTYEYTYVRPVQPYSNNLYIGDTQYDDFGNEMRWCWNGVSGAGKLTWEYVKVDLSSFADEPRVRLKFLSFIYAGNRGDGGWWIDDVEVVVTRDDDQTTTGSKDQWRLTNSESHSGDYSFWNGNEVTGYFSGGIDNSISTRPIDLTNARNATLSAYLKFNINTIAGRPPDGFRVEISENNGITWSSINFGVRSAWGVSGTGNDADDGVPGDGKSYTGINSGDNWVEAGSLSRLNCDVTGWAGDVIKLRFRVVIAADSNPYFGSTHYQSATAGFGGFYLDDVVIHGFSQLT